MKRTNKSFDRFLRSLLTGLIRVYQPAKRWILDPLVVTFFGAVSQCKYPESCSEYSLRMLKTHATIPAVRRSIQRILSCHG